MNEDSFPYSQNMALFLPFLVIFYQKSIHMKSITLICAFFALCLTGCGGEDDENTADTQTNAPQSQTPQTPSVPNDDITPKSNLQLEDLSESHYGHVYNQKSEKIAFTQDDLSSLQSNLQDKLFAQLSPSNQLKILNMQKAFAAESALQTTENQLLFNNVVAKSMLKNIDPKILLQTPFERYHYALRRQVFEHLQIRDIRSILPLLDYLRERGLLTHLIPRDSHDYIQQCRDADVPIPPDWGSGDWQFIGEQDRTFIGTSMTTEVWAYKSPHSDGTCIALPRVTSDESIQLLGIICQSTATGKACFWDNVDKSTGLRITGADAENMKITDLQNGNLLAENCTQCHRGENVFLIHPGETIDLRSEGYELVPDIRYQPVSTQAAWQNPSPHTELGDGACASCHEIPALTPSYCNSVLSQAARMTMPDTLSPAGWPAVAGFYQAHLEALQADCP